MNWAKIAMAAAVVSTIAGGFTLLRDKAPAHDKASTPSAAELAEVRTEVARLRGEVNHSKALLQARASAAQMAADEPADEPSDVSQQPEDMPHPVPARPGDPSLAEIQQTRLALFRDEPVDAAWKRDAEVSARRQIVDGLPPQARAGEVECRSSMCRVEIVHQDFEGYMSYVGRMFEGAHREWKGQVMGTVMERRPDGSVRAEHYYVRPGVDPMAAVLAQHQANLE